MIFYDDIKFYPTKQGYYLGQVNNQPKRLHIYIWEKHYGKIPRGFHIHHLDRDKSNNNINNLIILPRHEHLSFHSSLEENIEKARKSIKIARIKASEWHRSKEGKKWHKKHWNNYMKEKFEDKVEKKCEVCGSAFYAVKMFAYRSKYCCDNCKATALRRRRGICPRYAT